VNFLLVADFDAFICISKIRYLFKKFTLCTCYNMTKPLYLPCKSQQKSRRKCDHACAA